MQGKELIERSFRCQEVDRIPWVPFVGVHGAKFTGSTAGEYLLSADLIVDGVTKAAELYLADGIPVVFDLQIEAEALGCRLAWSEENPPAVISHPLAEGLTLQDLPEYSPGAGRLPIVAEATSRLRKALPDTALYGLVTGPYTLALHLMGTDIFLKMMMEPEIVTEVMTFTEQIVMKTAQVYIDHGCDVIALVDPMTSQIDPGSFEQFVTPHAQRIFEMIRQQGRLSSFFVCGQAQQNIKVMCECEPDNISIDENIPLDFVRDIALPMNISFGGNLKLTAVLLLGDEDDSRQDALNCMDTGGHRGFVLAPGCDLAMDTPEANLRAVAEINHDVYLQDVERARQTGGDKIQVLNLDDHWKTDTVTIDVITLDSSSCAPCQYMVEAMKKASAGMPGVVVNEYRIKNTEGLRMMKTLGVKAIPTACIEGKPEFESRIPSIDLIREKIGIYLADKGLS